MTLYFVLSSHRHLLFQHRQECVHHTAPPSIQKFTFLDAASEKLVFEALDRLMQGKTSIVIAHRLSTVRNADAIFVIDAGSIVESGRHEQLLESGGLYSKLYNIQFHGTEQNEELEPAQ